MIKTEDLLLSLLNIDSVTGNEKQITEYIKNYCAKFSKWKLFQYNNTLVYLPKISTNKPTLAFYGHSDTVHNQQDNPPYLDNGLIFGCGASDMKGGLAIMLQLMEFAEKENFNYNCQFIFYDCEESSYENSGLMGIFEKLPQLVSVDLAIILEPTSVDVQCGCLGTLNAQIKIKGKSGHSARPWEADNPINKSLPLLNKINDFKMNAKIINGLKFTETLTITKLFSGQTKNVIPDELSLNINYRFPPDQTINDAKNTIYSLVNKENIIKLDVAPAGKVVLDNNILSKLINMHSLSVKPKQAWTDVARLSKEGIDAINFGPGDPSQAHQKNENIKKSNLDNCQNILINFLTS